MLLDLVLRCQLGTGKPSARVALDSACYGLIVFSELFYVRRTSRGTSPVVGPHLGGGPTSPGLYALRFCQIPDWLL